MPLALVLMLGCSSLPRDSICAACWSAEDDETGKEKGEEWFSICDEDRVGLYGWGLEAARELDST